MSDHPETVPFNAGWLFGAWAFNLNVPPDRPALALGRAAARIRVRER